MLKSLINSVAKGRRSSRHSAAKRTRGQSSFPQDFDQQIISIFEAVQPFTMTSPERVFSLCTAVKYVVQHEIPGAIVECGVWKGGSMMAAALMLLQLGVTDRPLYLFDTFEGMSPPTSKDKNLNDQSADELLATSPKETAWVWAYSGRAEVEANLQSTHYPLSRMKLVQGKIEDTVPEEAPAQIALLRLDTDWYESTRHEMEHLYPRISQRGVLIVDDYGHWQGARLAVDEYLAKHQIPLLLNRIDYTGRIAVKAHP